MGHALAKLTLVPMIRLISEAMALLPRSVQLAMGCALGSLLRTLGYRRKVVEANASRAFGDSVPTGFIEKTYSELGKLFLEILYLFGPMHRFTNRYAVLHGKQFWQEAKAQSKGVIMLSSHVGNWEVMAASGGLNQLDLLMVTKHLKPEWVHQAIEAGRKRSGVLGTYEPRTLKDVLGHLKKNGTVGFVLDQYSGPPVGVRVPFLGVPVGTATIVAMLAKRTGATILPVTNRRLPNGSFEVTIEGPVQWISDPDSSRELALNTAEYARIIERHVRTNPEQWLWVHRRFKGDLSPLKDGEWSAGRPRQ